MNGKPKMRLAQRPRPAHRQAMRLALGAGLTSIAFGVVISLMLGGQIAVNKEAQAAVTYTSLRNGNWTNSTNVWSTNGSTACACNPGTTVDNRNVVINHAINMNADLTIKGGSQVDVSVSGSLSNSNYNLKIENGQVESYGNVSVKEIEIYSGAAGLFFGPVTSAVKFLVSGTILFDSLATVTNGNLELKGGSVTTAGTGWQINLLNGNLYAEGIIEFQGSCLIMPNGNFENKAGGDIRGYGYIETSNGNIYNNGAWDADVLWCASGTGNNLPTPESCMSGCNFGSPLPVQFVKFEAKPDGGRVRLAWSTAAEVNNDYFTIERSSDGSNFEPRLRVKGAGNSTVLKNYSAADSPVADGKYIYRLLQTDFDGTSVLLGTRAVHVTSSGTDRPVILTVFPNPFESEFNLECRLKEASEISLSLLSSAGRVMWTSRRNAEEGINHFRCEGLPAVEGLYYLVLQAGDGRSMVKVIRGSS
jgi:hypothetical protein